LHLNKQRLQGPRKKIKALRHGPFKILEKERNNAYIFSVPPYMCICSVVNVKNLKLYDSSMLNEYETGKGLLSIEELTLDAQVRLPKDNFS